ncbi:MAG TPA: DNA polymerase III subunit delta [Actinomycetota bacterium]|nr:DNA polymerase III subunit delta [Actinomycetota bacterium]
MTPKKAPAYPVHLLWGEDEFLLRERALELLGPVRPREVDGAEWQGGETSDLSTPSLFGDPRALLVSNARDLTNEAVDEVRRYLGAPNPDAPLILTARVGERARAPAALVKLVGGVGAVEEVRVQRRELPAWIQRRAVAKELALAPDAATALVETFGEEPAAIDQALVQLTSAYAGERITADLVARQFRGLGQQHIWDLCDRAFGRDLPGSMRSLRTLLAGRGGEGLMILGGIAARLRDLLRVRSLPERLPPAELARQAGLRFEWQARRYREQARRYELEELVRIHDHVAWADRALKSGATEDVVLPMVVTAIAGDPMAVPVPEPVG